jgi:hypothetical protein
MNYWIRTGVCDPWDWFFSVLKGTMRLDTAEQLVLNIGL